MSTSDIIAIIFGVAGWVAVGLILWQNHQQKKSSLRNNLETLDKLAGSWMDEISRITSTDDQLPVIAHRIKVFTDTQGGYQTDTFYPLRQLPSGGTFDEIRQKFGDFTKNALDIKEGLISNIVNAGDGGLDEGAWTTLRDDKVSTLRAECDRLQGLLRQAQT
jgi:hypothetical protein